RSAACQVGHKAARRGDVSSRPLPQPSRAPLPDLKTITCVEDFRRAARRRVPRMFYDYMDSGSWTESTYRANEADLQALKFRQRVAVDIARRSLRTRLLGEDAAMPLALAPTGLTGMQRADGEILAARAAERFGVPFTLSTMSICSIRSEERRVGKEGRCGWGSEY